MINKKTYILHWLLNQSPVSMEPGDSQRGTGVLPTAPRNRSALVVDFNAKVRSFPNDLCRLGACTGDIISKCGLCAAILEGS